MTESYILCEGYHDRAFWKGLLVHLGCVSQGMLGQVPKDPWSDPVRGGQFAFNSSRGNFIRVVPAGGKAKLLPLSEIRLQQRVDKPLRFLVINSDSDSNADGTPSTTKEIAFNSVLQLSKKLDPDAQEVEKHLISLDKNTTRIISFPWWSQTPPLLGLPNQQTLERLICTAFAAAYPNRPAAVHNWLLSRPDPPASNPKEHAFSYLAGWHAETGSYEGFCESLWRDPKIATELCQQLQSQGVWSLIEEIVEVR